MRLSLVSAAVFVASLIATTFLCAIFWEGFVRPNLYDCTDPGFIDYFSPGDWVHASGGQPVAVVQHVVHGRSMSEPDMIKQGWSVAGLWRLWYSFVSASILVSFTLGYLVWIAGRMDDQAST